MAKKHNKSTKSQCIRNGRLGTHIDNCKTGYREKGFCEIHHILCHGCMEDSAIKVPRADKGYIKRCLKITKWDINAAENVVGLPLKSAYYKRYGDAEKWDRWPCHQIDHNPHYREAIKEWLHEHVWNTLKAKQDDCDADEKSIASALSEGSTAWRKMLTDRGVQHGGTKLCWDERHGAKADVWYIPFSMFPTDDDIPRRLAPPVRWSGKMEEIFTHLLK